jgi:chorismate mutase
MQHLNIEKWGLQLNSPLIIAGPCSLESKEQLNALLPHYKSQKKAIGLFRAGVWKPRTRPGSFEGNGEKCLPWLKEFKQETGIPVTIEVGNANHVEKALEAGIDVLWIGARTTVNPFSVQEISEALRGVDIPVMVKNPLNPDLNLWIGALERLLSSGVNKLAAIHRGFADDYDKRFRNKPNWSLPIHLKREWSGMEVINDPSHICGKREMIEEVAQKAINFGLDGLMIESHPWPEKAWSDAAQQLSPEDLFAMLSRLDFKDILAPSHSLGELQELRSSIDFLDSKILDLLGERFNTIDRVGEYKQKHHLAVFQPERWQSVMNSRIEEGLKKNMSESFLKNLLFAIHEESVKRQERKIGLKHQDA